MRILYLTHVAWGWIKQRPQFIAEELSQDNIIDCYYAKSNRFNKANREFSEGKLSVKGFRFFPFERIPFFPLKWMDIINSIIFLFYRINISHYDIIWITEPRHYFLIRNKCKGKKLIYDCMDDMLEFPYMRKYPKLYDFEFESERQLVQDADFVICSAKALQKKLEVRYGIRREMVIVNNAITEEIATYSTKGEVLPNNSFVYVGTISEWFDFKSVIYALDKYPNINVLLYGPVRMQNPPQHERLIYKGAISHDQILGVMNGAAALVMPFVINELIESVNPVKLYEYIYSGKPICASKYEESEKFKDFVFLYSDEQEFASFVDYVLRGKFQTDNVQMREFALNNTWHSRAEQISELLK